MLGQTNAKVVGNNVEIIEERNGAFEQKVLYTQNGGYGYRLKNVLHLDNVQVIDCIGQYDGIKGLEISKIVKNISTNQAYLTSTRISFISLDFGQLYTNINSINMNLYSSISPDKTKLIVLHYNQAKISLVSLTTNGDDYNFGNVTTFDIGDFSSANQISFIDNNHFIVLSSPNIYYYEIENNTITLKATFTNTETITGFLNVGEIIMITNSSTRNVWFLDNIIDQNIIHTEKLTPSFEDISNSNNNSFVLDNKFFLHLIDSTSLPYKCFYINNNQIISVNLTGQTNVVNTNFGSCVVYKNIDNKISLLISSISKSNNTYSWINSIEIDFVLSTIKDSAVLPPQQTSYNVSNYGSGLLYFDGTDVFLRFNYIQTVWFYFNYYNENIAYKISYNGYDYTFSNKTV